MGQVKGDRGKCDALASALTRRHGVCEYCGDGLGFKNLHTSHYVGRGFTWTRTHLPNLVCACPPCHFKVENNPARHTRWFTELRGADVEAECHRRAEDGVTAAIKFDWAQERLRLIELCVKALAEPDIEHDAETRIRQLVPAARLKRMGSLR